MNISLQWYLNDYSERLHIYCYIFSECTTQVSVNLIDSLLRQIHGGFFFLTFRFIQIFDNIEVKYLPPPESCNNNIISLKTIKKKWGTP